MGKYLSLFNNYNEYSAFTESQNFVLPNVSHCMQENDTYYTPKYVCITGRILATGDDTIGYYMNISHVHNDNATTIEDMLDAYLYIKINGETVSFETLIQNDFQYSGASKNEIWDIEYCVPLRKLQEYQLGYRYPGNYYTFSSAWMTEINLPPYFKTFRYLALYGNETCEKVTGLESVEVFEENSCFHLGYFSITDNGIYNDKKFERPETANLKSVRTIGNNAFTASGFKHFIIGENIETVGENAFGSTKPETIVIEGTGLQSIGSKAFYDMADTSVTIMATTPPTLGEKVFYKSVRQGNKFVDVINTECKIYVPSSAVNTYKIATGWSEYASQIYPIE